MFPIFEPATSGTPLLPQLYYLVHPLVFWLLFALVRSRSDPPLARIRDATKIVPNPPRHSPPFPSLDSKLAFRHDSAARHLSSQSSSIDRRLHLGVATRGPPDREAASAEPRGAPNENTT